ncbi:MAG: DUF1269 domain-containing protein [Burkholderiales bacterium]
MRRRLYVVCPDLQAAQQTMNDLLLARIGENHIRVLAKPGAPMEGLNEASVLQKTDLVHGAEMGLVIGGIVGIILGVILILIPPGGLELQLVTVLIAAFGGALFGAWASSMAGAGIPNTRLLAFAKDIEEGRYLMMVDIPFHRVEEIQSLVRRRHPEDADGGVEPSIPAFP